MSCSCFSFRNNNKVTPTIIASPKHITHHAAPSTHFIDVKLSILVTDTNNNVLLRNSSHRFPSYTVMQVPDNEYKALSNLEYDSLFKLSFNWPNTNSIMQTIPESNPSRAFYSLFLSCVKYMSKKFNIPRHKMGILYRKPELESSLILIIHNIPSEIVNYMYLRNNYTWQPIITQDTKLIARISELILFSNSVYTPYCSPILRECKIFSYSPNPSPSVKIGFNGLQAAGAKQHHYRSYLSSSTTDSIIGNLKKDQETLFIGLVYIQSSTSIGTNIMVSKSGPFHSIPMFKIRFTDPVNRTQLNETKRWFVDCIKQYSNDTTPAEIKIQDILNTMVMSDLERNFLREFQDSVHELGKFLGTNHHLTFQQFYHGSLISFRKNCGLFTFVTSQMSTKQPKYYNEKHIDFISVSMFNTIHLAKFKEVYPKQWLTNVIEYNLTHKCTIESDTELIPNSTIVQA